MMLVMLMLVMQTHVTSQNATVILWWSLTCLEYVDAKGLGNPFDGGGSAE